MRGNWSKSSPKSLYLWDELRQAWRVGERVVEDDGVTDPNVLVRPALLVAVPLAQLGQHLE